MPGRYHHEELYRGSGATEKLAAVHVTLCGAGALGSHLADTLARQGFRRFRVIDHDRVEQHNVSTQIYGEADVGLWKGDVLRSHLFRAARVEAEVIKKELSERTARRLLKGTDLVLETFDNSASRRVVQEHCRQVGLACLHVGLHTDYGEVIWDEHYRVPEDVGENVCDYPLARNLVLMTVAVAAETVVRFVLSGQRLNWSITLRDLAVRALET
ncbi:MAG: ThiF family adenylyltransferase [Planctomycetes bacterium]|nr:ThiF family adenylyltransferase [Planctomycetota bacterium]